VSPVFKQFQCGDYTWTTWEEKAWQALPIEEEGERKVGHKRKDQVAGSTFRHFQDRAREKDEVDERKAEQDEGEMQAAQASMREGKGEHNWGGK